ncbi:hypothetical protein B0T17DRAFT_49809 [Bombardia bombarda]|uniref:Uncharacterized protein n=1 Tax=Bombardia bombarda TaxID=252184 RepID=A0AA39XLR9_9PEZI|nr:hypothetical protein B0T17DRAFT_49809 [Bombardia bombarda]
MSCHVIFWLCGQQDYPSCGYSLIVPFSLIDRSFRPLFSKTFIVSHHSLNRQRNQTIHLVTVHHSFQRTIQAPHRETMVNSVVWTDEETKFLKAVLRWNNTSEDSGGGSLNGGRTATSSSSTTTTTTTTKSTPETTAAAAAEKKRQQQQQQQRQQQQQKKHPTGEFRILVVGAKGVGKTSILTRVSPYSYIPLSKYPNTNEKHE